jgi:rhamnosyltransferase
MEKDKVDVSIIFLVYNGLSDHFSETLQSVLRQKTRFRYEIIAIDSGSTDGTHDFVRKYPAIHFHQISNSEFGHGKTRQLGAELSSGKYLVYLTQDATPTDENWLNNLINKLISKDDMVAVASRILPRIDAMPLRKYNVLSEWCAGSEDFEIKIDNIEEFKNLSGEEVRKYLKMHDVSSAYRAEFIKQKGFGDVAFGEDVIIARKILENGYVIGFASKSCVVHSHKYDIKRTYARNVIDGKFNRNLLDRATTDSVFKICWLTYKLMRRDFKMLLMDKEVSLKDKVKNMLYSPVIHFAEMYGQYIGNTRL